MASCALCSRAPCVVDTEANASRPLCLHHAFITRSEGYIADGAVAAQERKALKLTAIKAFDEICEQVSQQRLAAAQVAARRALSAMPPPLVPRPAPAQHKPAQKPTASRSWTVDATPRAAAPSSAGARRPMMERTELRAIVDAAPGLPLDDEVRLLVLGGARACADVCGTCEQRRRAITLLCNALYSNVNVVPASLDGLVAAAAALENECHSLAEYRSEVRALFVMGG